MCEALIAPLRRAAFARFAAIGVAATAVHGAGLHAVIVWGGLHPTVANIFAFSAAFLFSYLGHYYFSFRSRERHAKSAPRFFAIAMLGLGINSAIFAVIVNWLGLHYWIAFALVVVITPIVVFLASKRFAFGRSGRD